ncbi:EAL domain-containing protein [Marinomonas pollencensis]|uniref:Diguanylate cyclase/phosphodiesterase n=1 Tax=Marinomonas pollencensis TaxID=491954 RepID=A0A3E0DW07_9GAMM|nr:EAL domain-containing protein [Marinomonas pollencensis]REG85839.1 diguanylate cyclase/phosphodiesterase [Marinomonas pollencensis]
MKSILFFLMLFFGSLSHAYNVDNIPLSVLPTYVQNTPSSLPYIFNQATFDRALYRPSQRFSDEVIWHKIDFPTPEKTTSIDLQVSNHLIDELDFYLVQDGQQTQHWRRGANQVWQNHVSYYNGIWVNLTLQPEQQNSLYIRKHSRGPLLTPIQLYQGEETAHAKLSTTLFWTVALTGVLVLLTFNFIIFLQFRYAAFGYYLAFHCLVFLSLAMMIGASRWFFPEFVHHWLIETKVTLFVLAAWSLYRFTLGFLPNSSPATSTKFFTWVDWIFCIYFIISVVFSEKISAILFVFMQLSMILFCLRYGISSYRKGFTAARFYLFAIIMLSVGSTINSMMYWDLIPFNDITRAAFPLCSFLELLGFAIAFTDKAKQIELDTTVKIQTDSSTGLPNRYYYFDVLPLQLSKLKHSDLALVMIEITSHSQLSQAYGPKQAEQATSTLIQNLDNTLAQIQSVLSLPLPNHTSKKLIRISTNKVAFISLSKAELTGHIDTVQKFLDTPILIGHLDFHYQYNIGSALYPSQSNSLDSLYQNALIACNHIRVDIGTWQSFDQTLKQNYAHQLHLLTLLTQDLKNDALYFEIQPQVCLTSRKIIGGEVLLRWKNSQLGMVSPGEFIPLAEQAGLICKLTDFVIFRVFKWAAQHPELLLERTLSINISALDMLHEGFATKVIALQQYYQIPASQLVMEVTETSIFENSHVVFDNVNRLHKAGFKLSIDDFGVGYSSMQNLIALQTNELKIDRFFVAQSLTDKSSAILCRNMIQLSSEMNISSVAEGIENEEVALQLEQWRCLIGQGYHLYRPMPCDDYLSLLRS